MNNNLIEYYTWYSDLTTYQTIEIFYVISSQWQDFDISWKRQTLLLKNRYLQTDH